MHLQNKKLQNLAWIQKWNSQIDSLESFMKNQPYHLQIIEDRENNIKDIVFVKIVNEVKYLLWILKFIAVVLDKTKKKTLRYCFIADIWKIWLTLFDDENLMETHECKVQSRFINTVITDYHVLAYLLHPKYVGSKLM